MAIRPIIILPDPLLREPSKPVERIDDELRKFANDMLETMYDAPGIGLAAIQIGVPRRILVLDVAEKEQPQDPQVFINPEIVASSQNEFSVHEEGCLSIPEYFAEVERPARITVKSIGLDGKEKLTEADGLLATCLQHEIDHLNGILFIDYLSKLKRDIVIRKFKKLAKERASPQMVG